MSSEAENGYTFRMGDHEITMRDSFASMLDTTQLTDCLLVCHTYLKDGDTDDSATAVTGLTNGHTSPIPSLSRRSSLASGAKTEQILRTHRVILSASSDYFRSVFSSVPNILNNGVVAVIITNVDFDDLQSIIDFIYKGQVSVGQSRIHKFLAAAQLLMIKGLMNIKLVNNDDQPIEEPTFAENELIQKLKTEKRKLEIEIRAVKDLEKSKVDRIRRDLELELKKKFELEKSILSEEKQRFEAEKMKFTIEKEVFEKKKTIDKTSTTNCLNNNNNINNNNTNNSSVNKQIVVNNSNRSILIETLTQNGDKHNQNESIITTRSLRGSPNKPVIQSNTPQKTDTANNSMPETPTNEPEGRQLRKRKMNDSTDDGKESADEQKANPEEEQRMQVEDEDDGQIYEVDFSQSQDASSVQQETNKTEVIATNDSETDPTNTTSQTAAIIASTVAFHKASAVPTIVTPSSHQMPTRSLRRSTSSIGSASTQSMSGENGADGDSLTVRRKGPGRIPNWIKDEGTASALNAEATVETDSTPVTRARQQRVSQDSVLPVGVRQAPNTQLYTCPYCPQVYHGTQSMQDHINGVHLNQKTQYICDYCGKVYTWRISLNKHLRTVHPNEPIPE